MTKVRETQEQMNARATATGKSGQFSNDQAAAALLSALNFAAVGKNNAAGGKLLVDRE